MNIKNTKKILFGIIACVLIAAMGIIIWILLHQKEDETKAEEKLNSLRAYVTEADEEDTDTTLEVAQKPEIMEQLGIHIPNKKIDWQALRKKNKDIYAWLYIPDTNIDYPILQHETDNNYYIDHNLDGSKGYPGCITTQVEYNSRDFMDANTCIYGHNMKNGSMFQNLHKFEDSLFFKENEFAYIFTPQTTYVYQIFAAYTFGNALIPYAYDFSTRSGYQEYLDEVYSIRDMKAHFRDGIKVTPQNHIITLSTCTSPADDDHRWLVQGVMVNDPTLTDEEISAVFSNRAQ